MTVLAALAEVGARPAEEEVVVLAGADVVLDLLVQGAWSGARSRALPLW
jgi:hypothetical protein